MPDVPAPGWDVITNAFKAIYGDQEPLQWAPAASSNQSLDGISAYRSDQSRPHWHLVTYGFTELYGKDGGGPIHSGFGFEFTMRLPRGAGEEAPPAWALTFLRQTARYVFRSGRPFKLGDHLDCKGCLDPDDGTSKVTAVACVADPELGAEMRSPNGIFRFVQVYGITRAELDEILMWSTAKVAGMLAQRDAMMMTDFRREDFHGDAGLRAAIQRASLREPASTGALFMAATVSTQGARKRLTIAAAAVANLVRLVPKRLGFGAELMLTGEEHDILLHPADVAPTRSGDQVSALIPLNAAEQRALATTVRAQAGVYPLSGRYEIAVEGAAGA